MLRKRIRLAPTYPTSQPEYDDINRFYQRPRRGVRPTTTKRECDADREGPAGHYTTTSTMFDSFFQLPFLYIRITCIIREFRIRKYKQRNKKNKFKQLTHSEINKLKNFLQFYLIKLINIKFFVLKEVNYITFIVHEILSY